MCSYVVFMVSAGMGLVLRVSPCVYSGLSNLQRCLCVGVFLFPCVRLHGRVCFAFIRPKSCASLAKS